MRGGKKEEEHEANLYYFPHTKVDHSAAIGVWVVANGDLAKSPRVICSNKASEQGYRDGYIHYIGIDTPVY